MESMRRVKGIFCGREILAEEGLIYLESEECKASNKALFMLLLFPSGRLCAFIMSRLWRAQNRARGPNRGISLNGASPSDADDSTPPQ